jgi:hypothetical protein
VDLGQWIVIILSILMGAWYIVGSVINRRKGIATYRWLRAGLEKYGKISEAKWIGSAASGARLAVAQAGSPFRRIETVFLLNSREILPLWLFNLLRSKSDEMVLKADLRKAPVFQLEVFAPGKVNEEKLAEQAGKKTIHQEELHGLTAARWGEATPQDEQALEGLLRQYGGEIITLSLRRSTPNLIVKVRLPGLQNAEAEVFFAALAAWVRGAAVQEEETDEVSDSEAA